MEKKIIFLGLFLAVTHYVAAVNNWYQRFGWVDIPMHFLGGVLIGMIFIWLFRKFLGNIGLHSRFFVFTVFLLGFVAFIGVLWEFYEFLYDLFISSRGWDRLASQQGIQDTMGDLFFDMLGGFMVAVLIRFGYNKKEV